MAFFSQSGRPSWSDMSFEYKGLFFYHICMMALFIMPVTGRHLDYAEYVFIAAAIGLAIAIASAIRRSRHAWHWRGAGIKEVLVLIVTTALMAFFFSSATSKFPPPVTLMPWYLAGFGIYVFAALNILNV